jgi:catechol 2,3-dioxygenase-like lactoylglutathione lyase family enzyme
MIRDACTFAAGVLVAFAVQGPAPGPRDIVSLNHVAIAVDDFEQATKFYTDGMGFPRAFTFNEPDGRPMLSYFQVNRNTFIEVMPATPKRPRGFVHYGLEVRNLDALIPRLRAAGMDVRAPSVSPRTKSRIAVARTPDGTSIELLEFGPDSLHRAVMDAWK